MVKGCFMCGERKNKKMTKHHVIPKSLGGTERDDYKLSICRDCHDEIHTRLDRILNPTFEDVLRDLIKLKARWLNSHLN